MKEIRQFYLEKDAPIYSGNFFNGDPYIAWDVGNLKLISLCFKTPEDIERVVKVLQQKAKDLRKEKKC